MKLTFLSLATIVFLCSGCGTFRSSTWVEFEETKCANFWENGTSKSDNKDNVKDFLESNNVEVYSVTIKDNGVAEDCEACTCKSGRIISANVSNDDLKIAESFGFKPRS